MSALPEKYRVATNVKEGYEIRSAEGEWNTVVSKLHITAPLNIVRFEMSDGQAHVMHPRTEVMSRRTEAVPS